MYITLALFCCHFVVNFQGRNFGVKSGGTNSARGAFGSWGERGREWRASVPSSFDSGVWESVVSSRSGVRGGAWAENGLISADRLCSQQVTANSSHFRPEKWGKRAAQPRSVGDNVPHFWDQRCIGGTEGRSNENDLCFYNSADSSRHLPS